jgi:hypothetical protein
MRGASQSDREGRTILPHKIMKNAPSNRWLILASPRGDLTARPADFHRRFPGVPDAKWQRLISVRLPAGRRFEQVKDEAFGWAVYTYRL